MPKTIDSYSDNPTKDEILARVRELIEPHGREVAMVAAEFALHPPRMRFLLDKLGLPISPTFEGRINSLSDHLDQTDPQRFLRRARREIWIDMQKAGVGQTTQTGPPVDEGLKSIMPPPAKRTGPVYRLPSGAPTIRLTPPPVTARAKPASRPAPPPLAPPPANLVKNSTLDWIEHDDDEPSAPRVSSEPSKSAPPPADGPMIDVPGYKGPERRATKSDRREGKSRRDTVEAISKNKRIGRDRRKSPRGRRATDKKA